MASTGAAGRGASLAGLAVGGCGKDVNKRWLGRIWEIREKIHLHLEPEVVVVIPV